MFSWNINLLICFSKRIAQNFARFELRQAPGAVIDIISKWDKRRGVSKNFEKEERVLTWLNVVYFIIIPPRSY